MERQPLFIIVPYEQYDRKTWGRVPCDPEWISKPVKIFYEKRYVKRVQQMCNCATSVQRWGELK